MQPSWDELLEAERMQPRAARGWEEGQSDVGSLDQRSPYERDRDRVLYSAVFRRLAGVAQVTAVHERHLLHTRLTHSLKVAQIGRRIAERLIHQTPWLIDEDHAPEFNPDVIETACLAHDLGHPPFGHAAERVLHGLLRKSYGGFEGNAQTFRIVTKLAVREQDADNKALLGLQLTQASLNAILKYPRFWPPKAVHPSPWTDRSKGVKWGVYRSELKDFQFARGDKTLEPKHKDKEQRVRSLNAIVMDWADDISFATHDLEDFIQSGLIMPERLSEISKDDSPFHEYAWQELRERYGDRADKEEFEKAFKTVAKRWPKSTVPFDGTRAQQAWLRNQLVPWIRGFDNACYAVAEEPYVKVGRQAQYQAEVLKAITNYFVVGHPALRTAERGQKKLVEDLFDLLTSLLEESRYGHGIPTVLYDYYLICCDEEDCVPRDVSRRDYSIARAVADYICSLTEEQALDLFQRMTGLSRASIFGTWFK